MYQGNHQPSVFTNKIQQNMGPNDGIRIHQMNPSIQPNRRGTPVMQHQVSSARPANQSSFVNTHNNYRPVSSMQNSFQQNNNNNMPPANQYNTARNLPNSTRYNQSFSNKFSGFNSQQATTANTFTSSSATSVASASRNNFQGQNRNESLNNKSNRLTSNTGMMPTPKPRLSTMPNFNSQISGLIPVAGSFTHKGTQRVTQMTNTARRSRFRKFGDRDNEKLCILTGSVERIIKYGKIFQNHFCYYQVFGCVVAITDGNIRFEKKMLLRDKRGGPVLQLTYYCNSTHINIVDFYIGQELRAVGRMIGPNNMSALSIRAATQQELDNLLRMSYISDYAVHYYCGEKQTVASVCS
ncbi:hybrid signal transduction histidine kinase D-like isoform X3 [Anthonomus grandis grandis]|uniref:hybrid signal transduction histidine kinase D-like isoform X3 n=1 Tax=Anthonomus grandis grandis TaxID=2921223 RepID=UPI00216563AD|nr:hybrid signal transduction histidine kinase D-like isoform X3 [Anthonomus grandis grandis]